MRRFDAAAVAAALPTQKLVVALREAFRGGVTTPTRHHHAIPVPGEPDATLLLMPAWRVGGYVGVKVVTVFPGNGARGLPSVMGSYLLLDGSSGAPLAALDGPMLTLRRTAAASALAATHLARPDAARLLMVGTGALAPHLVRAHAAVRPIGEVAVWGRDRFKAERLARDLAAPGLAARAADDLEAAARAADVISCATLAREPLIRGAWLRPGQHLDLVGAYTPAMRESDDEAVRRARIFVDTPTALQEGGDVAQPLAAGVLAGSAIAGDLAALCRRGAAGRRSPDEITLFKSTGTALEDLAAAVLVYENAEVDTPPRAC
jgi:ornithine cyclodeaminase